MAALVKEEPPMPSPFPGMNPYLERSGVWNDFHLTLIPVLRQLLLPHVSPAYDIRLDQHLYIHEPESTERRPLGRGDLHVAREPADATRAAAAAVLEAPARGRILIPDYERQPYLEIRDRDGEEVVTVIELLSPSNKAPGKDRDHYLAKRDEVLWSGAHLVEIDLLRAGRRPPIEGLAPCDYYVMVSRAEMRPDVELWPIRLRDALPPVPVPLRAPHADAPLDLQAALHRAYDSAGYRFIYRYDPEPPLSPEDGTWAQQFFPARP
jgi:hypothetical protein